LLFNTKCNNIINVKIITLGQKIDENDYYKEIKMRKESVKKTIINKLCEEESIFEYQQSVKIIPASDSP
jgi:hypothetical protein